MKLSKVFASVLLVSFTIAHHVITHFLVNGIRETNVLRQPGTVSPITNLGSQDLACGFPPGNGQGMKGTGSATIQPGSKLTFEWHTNWSGSTPGPDGVTDVSHKGPCAIYMRRVLDSVAARAQDPRQPGWFKIWEDGVDANGVFCTTRMRQNGGFFTGNVPKNLENGDYLIRAETITLNNAAEPNNQPQWYVGCAQATLRNSWAPFVKPITVQIPSSDYANMNMPGLRYNIWYPERNNFSDYDPIPGPAVFYDGSDGFETPGDKISSDKKSRDTDTPTSTKSSIVVAPTSTTTSTNPTHLSLPDGFTTIPWPTISSMSARSTWILTSTITITANKPTSTSTSTIIVTATRTPDRTRSRQTITHTKAVTRTITVGITKTVYITPTWTQSSEHSHYKTVTRTQVTSVTRIIYAGPKDTAYGQKAEPTVVKEDIDPLGAHYSSHAHGTTFQYRHWHRRHARIRRF